MKAIADFCIIPIGVGTSLSPYVAECQKIFQKHQLNYSLHSYGTNVEGPWDEVFVALKECHERLHHMGAPRVSSSIRLGTRTDREQTLEEKIESVRQKQLG